MTNHTSTTTTRQLREAGVYALARELGHDPSTFTPEIWFALGRLDAAQRIAESEGVGSGELPGRLQRRVDDFRHELDWLVKRSQSEQEDTQPAIERQSTEATEPRPIDLGVSTMLTTCFTGGTQWEAVRVPLNAVAEIVGEPWDGSKEHEATLRLTLAQDQNCPSWVRDCRMCFADAGFVVLLGPFTPSAIPPEGEESSEEAFTDGCAYGIRSCVEQLQDGVKAGKPMPEIEAELIRQAEVSEARSARIASRDDDAAEPKPQKRSVEVLDATDTLYDAHTLLAYLWRSLGRSPIEGLDFAPDEAAGLIGEIDRARWLVHDARNVLLGEDPADGGAA